MAISGLVLAAKRAGPVVILVGDVVGYWKFNGCLRTELGDVRTWYDERGRANARVAAGGADARAWAPNIEGLAAHFHVFTPERRSHGRTPDVEGALLETERRHNDEAFNTQ